MMLFRRPSPEKAGWIIQTLRGLAIVAAVFTIIVSVLMIANTIQLAASDPLDDPLLLSLR